MVEAAKGMWQATKAQESIGVADDEDSRDLPLRGAPSVAELHGAMRGSVYVPPGVDLTEPTGEVWEAEFLA